MDVYIFINTPVLMPGMNSLLRSMGECGVEVGGGGGEVLLMRVEVRCILS